MNESTDRESILTSGTVAPIHSCHEISFTASRADCPELPLVVAYRLPSGATKTTRGFATGDGKMKARAYVDEEGFWSWEAKDYKGQVLEAGSFKTVGSSLPGKIKISHADPRQLQYGNGNWCLQFGDNEYRLLDPNESKWKSCIDQAAQAGFNRARVWLCPPEQSLFESDGSRLDLTAWERIEERLLFALRRHPELQFEISLFGSDQEELSRFGDGDPKTHLRLRYAIERFGPLPNVHWNIANNVPDPNSPLGQAAATAGLAISENNPWNSLVTLTRPRFEPVALGDQKFISFQSIQSLGQVTGESVLVTRAAEAKPVALVEDRSEHALKPRFPRYFFRRLFWSTLLSGGLPTYSGLDTSKSSDRGNAYISGYYDACNSGDLRFGAHDILNIRKFFAETGIRLENWRPNDHLSGDAPLLVKSALSDDGSEVIAYVANPQFHENHNPDGYAGSYSDEIADANEIFTTFTLELPFSDGLAKWFNPLTGEWRGEAQITRNSTTFLTPEPGDWVVWVKQAWPA